MTPGWGEAPAVRHNKLTNLGTPGRMPGVSLSAGRCIDEPGEVWLGAVNVPLLTMRAPWVSASSRLLPSGEVERGLTPQCGVLTDGPA